MRPIPPLAIFTLFCVGLQAIVGICLGLSTGLSETHKSVLVGFIVAFPALTLPIFLYILARAERAEAAWYYASSEEHAAEPSAQNVNAA